MLRHLGYQVPIQLWYLSRRDWHQAMGTLLSELGVECINANRERKKRPVRHLGGWELKAFALLHSHFDEVLLLDADNVPVVDPQFLFETPEFHNTGALFWPDRDHARSKKPLPIWRS